MDSHLFARIKSKAFSAASIKACRYTAYTALGSSSGAFVSIIVASAFDATVRFEFSLRKKLTPFLEESLASSQQPTVLATISVHK